MFLVIIKKCLLTILAVYFKKRRKECYLECIYFYMRHIYFYYMHLCMCFMNGRYFMGLLNMAIQIKNVYFSF